MDDNPNNLHKINDQDSRLSEKLILNGNIREFYQRNSIRLGLNDANDEDLILISDVDEIPLLDKIKFDQLKNQIVFFNQIFCCYKFNLFSSMRWCGTRMIKRKNLISPQWLRDIKDRNYPKWRIDTYFSKKKYSNIKFIEDGGWHFSYLKKASGVEKKLKSIRHHIEYDLNPLGVDKIEKMINERKLIYNYKSDQRTANKFEDNETLNKLEMVKLPEYIRNNEKLFSEWLVK